MVEGRLRRPVDDASAATPRSTHHADRAIMIVGGLVFGPLIGLWIVLLLGDALSETTGIRFGVRWGVGFGLAIGLGHGLSASAWGRFTVARAWLACRGRLPWQLISFLDDAHRRGVLRQVGAVYQFRHALLQDHLAGRNSPSSGAEDR